MEKGKIIFKILMLFFVIQIIGTITVHAVSNTAGGTISRPSSSSSSGFWKEIFEKGDSFLGAGKGIASGDEAATDLETMGIMNDLYNVVFPLGVVTTVIVGVVLGIKFMASSAEDKAKVKESMVPYVVGCVVIYGAFGIWKICIQILSALS